MRIFETAEAKWARKRRELGYDPDHPIQPQAAPARSNYQAASTSSGFDLGDWLKAIYAWVAVIVWIVTFIGSWIYCISEYGYLWGVGLGWLPSLIVATIAAFLWPLVAIGVLFLLEKGQFNL